MADLQQALLSGAATIAGAVLFFRGFRDLRLRRLIADTPTAKIRSMAMGLVEIHGRAEARSLVTAPFSNRACAYWQVEVAVRGRRNSWTTVHRNSSGHPFLVRDETGVAMVYPRGAECRLNFGIEEECLGLTLPAPYSEYLAEVRPASGILWRLSTLRFRERTLDEGGSVYVLGTAMPRGAEHVIAEGEAFAATGTDGDSWSRQVQQRSQEVAAVVRLGENEKVFIISQTQERDLSMWLGLQAWARLAGGPLLALGGLAFLLDAVR